MIIIIWIIIVACLSGCAGCPYSFTGSSVPPHLKTIAIPLFDDQSGFSEPNLRELLTMKVIERFTGDNTLQVVDRTNADSILEGIIIRVQDEPLVVEKGEAVTRSKITITVKATYEDKKLKKRAWEKQFSNWGIWELSGGPAQRQASINEALDKLAEDLLLETVSGW